MIHTKDEFRTNRNHLEALLRQAGCTIKGTSTTCPAHEDKHASASIYTDEKGIWRVKCHVPTCGFCGDIFDLEAKLSNKPVADLLREVNQPKETEKPKRKFLTVQDVEKSVSSLGKIEGSFAYTNPDTGKVDVLQIRYFSTEENRKKFLTHRPDGGGFVLGAPPKPWPIYNRTRLRTSDTVIVVEGEKKVHALNQLGIVATTSLSGSANADKADWSPLAGKTIYLWPDNDDAGRGYMAKVAELCGTLTPTPTMRLIDVEPLELQECGDVVDYIEQHHGITAEDLWIVIREQSRPIGPAAELSDHVDDIICGTWMSYDWPSMSHLSGMAKALFPGTTTVICGSPGASKSFFLLQCCYQWHKNGIPVALLEMEMSRKIHLHRLLAQVAQNGDLLNDEWCRENSVELNKIAERHQKTIDEFASSLHSKTGTMNYAMLLEWMKKQIDAGKKIIAVDPITSIDVGERRDLEDRKFIDHVQDLIVPAGARLIMVTHPRGSTNKGVDMDAMAGGRAFSRHTDSVLWMHSHMPAENKLLKRYTDNYYMKINRSIKIEKARMGRGTGRAIGFLMGPGCVFAEQGMILRDGENE